MENARILPSLRVDGQCALVTGAGRGIGRGAAIALAEAGATVIPVSRTREEVEAVAEQIRTLGGKARALVGDVSDPDAVTELFAAAGPLDIVVNNAGVAAPGPLVDLDLADIDRLLSVNVRGATLVAQAAARHMTAEGRGVIINISSTFGKVGRHGNAVYSATKHYVEGLTKSLAVELAPQGVRVVAVGPTAIVTPMTEARLAQPEYGDDLLSRIPLGRFGEVEDVVGAIVFLASPGAALISGTTLMVDGGWTAQ